MYFIIQLTKHAVNWINDFNRCVGLKNNFGFMRPKSILEKPEKGLSKLCEELRNLYPEIHYVFLFFRMPIVVVLFFSSKCIYIVST